MLRPSKEMDAKFQALKLEQACLHNVLTTGELASLSPFPLPYLPPSIAKEVNLILTGLG